MTHISYDPQGVPARFEINKDNQAVVEFSDPSFTRAETVMFDPLTRELYALLHEGVFTIGEVPKDFETALHQEKQVLLCADHYAGHKVQMKAALRLIN